MGRQRYSNRKRSTRRAGSWLSPGCLHRLSSPGFGFRWSLGPRGCPRNERASFKFLVLLRCFAVLISLYLYIVIPLLPLLASSFYFYSFSYGLYFWGGQVFRLPIFTWSFAGLTSPDTEGGSGLIIARLLPPTRLAIDSLMLGLGVIFIFIGQTGVKYSRCWGVLGLPSLPGGKILGLQA